MDKSWKETKEEVNKRKKGGGKFGCEKKNVMGIKKWKERWI